MHHGEPGDEHPEGGLDDESLDGAAGAGALPGAEVGRVARLQVAKIRGLGDVALLLIWTRHAFYISNKLRDEHSINFIYHCIVRNTGSLGFN